MAQISNAELAGQIGELTKIVTAFIATQAEINKMVDDNSECINGNGKDGLKTVVRLLDGRMEVLEKRDDRRQALVNSLVVALAITFLLNVLQIAF